ncbi:preprotein translocase subunit SecA [Candidatus Phytoplasma pini]|uniref:Protein translocase subunit SecA n=1 Tax=Candidatus Phytoplasma pini TaxID=267362 RepID=A0A559KJC9_9MOLU|nr:preprotein translocase subunit SecA [Candidatus Phytoplasma pini]TVY12236.1 Protein translocase subunit SecA [Candidatus Phytoplasma pini]
MLFNFFNYSYRYLKKIQKIANDIAKLRDSNFQLKDEDFPKETQKFKELFRQGTSLDELLIPAFALVCEASRRVTGLIPYHVQLLGAIVLHRGNIAEMKTGEGKTLTSVMPAYLNALSGNSVHIVTVNEYLTIRESKGHIGDIFRFLGMSVGLNLKEYTLKEKQQAYACDILYSTNSELAFDYLRDNMVTDINNLLMTRKYNYAIIDEVDSILIDEARNPLIISSSSNKEQRFYRDANRFVKTLKENHYIIDLESKTIELTEEGIKKGESFFQMNDLYTQDNYILLHYIKNALKACFIMRKNVDYLVDKDRVLIIDQFTGRVLHGSQFSNGLHQALEAKEGCTIREETDILATITYQNFFRLYAKISGMTGTAKTEEKEFLSIYKTKVITIPTNKPIIREDSPDFVFLTLDDKWEALLDDIEERYLKKQPVLIGTVSVDVSELISKKLKKRRIPHEILNAKNHFKEAEIIAKAGNKSSITIATNMAGRGTDIRLGEGVVELGGLAVLGTERHESRRIDNQLKGRAGRQGDPGFSRFFVSGEDELVKNFGGNKIKSLISLLQKTKTDDKSVSSKIFTRFFINLQKKIESSNFDYRKFVLQFDSVIGLQRDIIYKQRRSILTSQNPEELLLVIIEKTLEEKITSFYRNKKNLLDNNNLKDFIENLENLFFLQKFFSIEDLNKLTKIYSSENNLFVKIVKEMFFEKSKNILQERKQKLDQVDKNYYSNILITIMLRNIDIHFKNHNSDMNTLTKSINFVSYGQQNSLIVYQQKGQMFFNQMIKDISYNITQNILKFDFLKEILRKIKYNVDYSNDADKLSSDKIKKNNRNTKKPWN